MHKNNIRRQRKLENRTDETVRIASIAQKGMNTGRSSYVEMRALDRLTSHNIKTKILLLKKTTKLNDKLEEFLSKISETLSESDTRVLTPNGIVTKKRTRSSTLDRLRHCHVHRDDRSRIEVAYDFRCHEYSEGTGRRETRVCRFPQSLR